MFKWVVTIILVIWQYNYWTGVIQRRAEKKKDIETEKRNEHRERKFRKTRLFRGILIDDNNKMFKIPGRPEYIYFKELTGYKLYQDNKTITSGTKGAAINVGFGLTLGGTTEIETTTEVEKIDIVYNVNDINTGRYTYSLLDSPVKQNSEKYRITIEKAEDIANFFEEIMNGQKT